jgi:hypothetical protein
MVVAHVEPGICGFHTEIRVMKIKTGRVGIVITSDCEQVTCLGNEIKELDIRETLKIPIDKNLAYEKAGLCSLHPGCPVPCGLIKASEVELGLALKKDIKITFHSED